MSQGVSGHMTLSSPGVMTLPTAPPTYESIDNVYHAATSGATVTSVYPALSMDNVQLSPVSQPREADQDGARKLSFVSSGQPFKGRNYKQRQNFIW